MTRHHGNSDSMHRSDSGSSHSKDGRQHRQCQSQRTQEASLFRYGIWGLVEPDIAEDQVLEEEDITLSLSGRAHV